jgi:resuscitation-promoting factor RpfA
MHAHGRPRLARFLAPLALIAFAIAVVMIVSGSGVTGDDSSSGSSSAGELPSATDRTNTETTRKRNRIPATYTIRANDTLSGIAARWGTTVDKLQELNPELDPQGLVAGQKIKLRE